MAKNDLVIYITLDLKEHLCFVLEKSRRYSHLQ